MTPKRIKFYTHIIVLGNSTINWIYLENGFLWAIVVVGKSWWLFLLMLFSLHEFVVVALDELEVVCWPESDSPPAASVDKQSFAAALGVAVEEETNFPSSTAVDWGCCNWVLVQVVQQALFSTSSGFFGLFSHYFLPHTWNNSYCYVLKLQSQFSITLRAFLAGIKSHL